MPTFFRILILSLAVLTARATDKVGIQSGPRWLKTVPEDLGKKISASEVADGYYFLLLDRQINLAANTEYSHVIRQVVNAAGVQNSSEISVQFAPQFQHLIFHQALVIRDGRQIDQLKRNRIRIVEEEADAQDFIYRGVKRAYITLLDVQPGDRVEYAYSLEGFNPVFSSRYSADYFFSGNTPYANYFVSVLVPAGRSLNVRTYNGAPQPEEIADGNAKIYRWSNPQIDFTGGKPDMPSWYNRAPSVSVTEFGSWKEVVDWGLTTFGKDEYRLPASLETQISAWQREAAGNKDLFTCLALRYVQDHIRYLGMEIGTSTHKPRDPATVFVSGFGDCKDKALLLVTILGHLKIDASVALLNSTDRWMLKESLPSPNRFDHAIVALKRGSGYFFVDPTISLQRGKLLESYLPAYGYALVLKAGESEPEPVNQTCVSEVAITESLNLSSGYDGKFEVTTLYKGGPADNARGNFASNSIKALGASFTGYYSKIYENIGMVSLPVITDDSLTNQMTITENYRIPRAWQKQNQGRPAFSAYAKSIDERLPGLPSGTADAPLALRYPQTVAYTMKLNMPEEFVTRFDPLHIRNASFQFDFVQEKSGKELVYTYYLKTFRDYIPAGEIAQYKTDYSRISDCLSFRFTRTAAGESPPSVAAPGGLNWINLWISFVFGVCFSGLFRTYNKRTEAAASVPGPLPFGGWTLVLGLTLLARFIFQALFFEQENYFQQEVWDSLYRIGGAKLMMVYVLEMIGGLWNLFGLGALIYWFAQRRNLFPFLFRGHLSVLLLFQLSVPVISAFFNIDSAAGMRSGVWAELGGTIIYTAVWVTYVFRSERVRQTFVIPQVSDERRP